jgi:hypothetical protein
MKIKTLFSVLALTLIISISARAQDEVAVYGLSQTGVIDNLNGVIASYSAMESTFAVALISNVYHEGAIFEGEETFVYGQFSYQRFFAEVGFSIGNATFATDYYYAGKYFLELIDIGPCNTGFFWIDYYGFGFLPADHPSPYSWPSSPTLCATTALIYLGAIPVITSLTQNGEENKPGSYTLKDCKTASFRECVAHPFDAKIDYKYTSCATGATVPRTFTKRQSGSCFFYKYECDANGYTLVEVNSCIPDRTLDKRWRYLCADCS